MDARILVPGDEAILKDVALLADDEIDLARAALLLRDPTFVAAACLDDGVACGIAYGQVLRQLERDALLLYSMDVDETHRRRGGGRAMIAALRRLCAERGLYEMWVVTNASNEPAMRLYQDSTGVREAPDDVVFVFSPLES